MQNKTTWHLLIIFILINISFGKPLLATGKPNSLIVALIIATTVHSSTGDLFSRASPMCPLSEWDDLMGFFDDYGTDELVNGDSEDCCRVKSFANYYVYFLETLTKKNILLPDHDYKSREKYDKSCSEDKLHRYKWPACLRALDTVEKDIIDLPESTSQILKDHLTELYLYLEFQKVLDEARRRHTDITDIHPGFTPIDYCSALSLTKEELKSLMKNRKTEYDACIKIHKKFFTGTQKKLAKKDQKKEAQAKQPKIRRSKKN